VLHKKKLIRPSTSSCSTPNYNSTPNNNKSAASIKQTGILLNLESFIPTNFNRSKNQLMNNRKVYKKEPTPLKGL
jgi:hypothetical protein